MRDQRFQVAVAVICMGLTYIAAWGLCTPGNKLLSGFGDDRMYGGPLSDAMLWFQLPIIISLEASMYTPNLMLCLADKIASRYSLNSYPPITSSGFCSCIAGEG